jgi:hypothetical protein
LRAALQASNSHSGQDGIFFSLPAGSVINLTGPLPSITDAVDIIGPGADKLTVQRNTGGNYRIFNVLNNGTMTISGLTIANGLNSPPGPNFTDPDGGGIQNGSDANQTTATVNLTNCIISGNQAYNGGGINNRSGTMHITGCLITGNQCQNFNTNISRFGQGGGIYNFDTMTITNSEVDRNTANGDANHQGLGGGIFNEGSVSVVNSTISRNTAISSGNTFGGVGGGIYNDISLDVTNSTVALNFSVNGSNGTAGAGGIHYHGSGNITNSTIASNLPSGVVKGADPVTVKSSIIAKNSSSNVDVTGNFTSSGFNLIGSTAGSTGFTAATDQTGDPMFDPAGLTNNGGPTETIALLAGSPAIDKGSSSGLTGNLSDDQRGVGYVRTIDGPTPNATGGDGTDIGAFEVGAGFSAVSRKTHGTASLFDINLPLTGNPLGIEGRRNTGGDSSGPNVGHDHEVVLTFPRAVTLSGASVTSSTSSDSPSATATVSSNVVTVDLHNIPDIRRLSLNLTSVSDGTNTNDIKIQMGVLLADVNGSQRVDAADISLVRQQTLQTLTTSNFREDINLSGRIDGADVSIARQNTVHSLP